MNPSPHLPAAAPRADLRDTLCALGRIGARGRIGPEVLRDALREVAAPSLRLLAYAVGLKVPPEQTHAELITHCVPTFRRHFKSAVLRIGTSPEAAPRRPTTVLPLGV